MLRRKRFIPEFKVNAALPWGDGGQGNPSVTPISDPKLWNVSVLGGFGMRKLAADGVAERRRRDDSNS